MKRIYLDNNATTPQAPEVTEAMRPFFEEHFANPASTHREGQKVRHRLEAARARVAELIEASPEEIVFTSGGTESINLAILGAARKRPDGHIVTTAIEHAAGLEAVRRFEEEGGTATYVRSRSSGDIDPQAVIDAIRPDTVLVSVMHSNNETGVLQPIEPLARECNRRTILFHTDAAQSCGKISISVRETPVDLVSLAAHKFYGPKGVGALYIRKGIDLLPQMFGGGQQGSRRSGTEATALAVGMGRACELARSAPGSYLERIAPLRDRLERGLVAAYPGATVNGSNALRLPNTSSVRFPGIRGEEMVISLDLQGIAVSPGAACSSGAHRPSHVLIGMGLGADLARSSVRFSLGLYSLPEEIDRVLQVIPEITAGLRGMGNRMSTAAGKEGDRA
ncbi:MAG: cysteine desulfurase family protein [Acidobacteria bacterium]|nr:cysteine desulfurase family protein [Acidobacteriota bacterium]